MTLNQVFEDRRVVKRHHKHQDLNVTKVLASLGKKHKHRVAEDARLRCANFCESSEGHCSLFPRKVICGFYVPEDCGQFKKSNKVFRKYRLRS